LHCVDDHAAKSGLGPSPIRVLSSSSAMIPTRC
jgi:hypothetical protein